MSTKPSSEETADLQGAFPRLSEAQIAALGAEGRAGPSSRATSCSPRETGRRLLRHPRREGGLGRGERDIRGAGDRRSDSAAQNKSREGVGRTPDYDPHHRRRPAQEPTPCVRPNKPTGSLRGPSSSYKEPRRATRSISLPPVRLQSKGACGLGGSLMDLLDCAEDTPGRPRRSRRRPAPAGTSRHRSRAGASLVSVWRRFMACPPGINRFGFSNDVGLCHGHHVAGKPPASTNAIQAWLRGIDSFPERSQSGERRMG